MTSDGDASIDRGINDGGGMSHYTAAFGVPETVDKSPHRPLNQRRRRERHEAERRPHHLASAWVARRPTLHAYRNPESHLRI
ncbi:hypothetical protein F511_09710 [Dorcoceras hygrometricum]|uniref:Uncharacterized protein n=1 Tax=Dorcoceras hygrometricum TaxID=472368 RepID=A0A2Z7CPA9_9LAMI|nr:hypothetical protein F511_09710 [Dorcoceras hygrometricum]